VRAVLMAFASTWAAVTAALQPAQPALHWNGHLGTAFCTAAEHVVGAAKPGYALREPAVYLRRESGCAPL